MSMEQLVVVLKCFVLAQADVPSLFAAVAGEAAHHVAETESIKLCHLLHWIARSGFRDQTLMAILANEVTLRMNDNFTVAMLIEVMNAFAKLDTLVPRLRSAALRELGPLLPDLSKDQCIACTPVMVLTLPDAPLAGYLRRCAELRLGLPLAAQKPAVIRQLRLLEHALREHAPLPATAQDWLRALRFEAEQLAPGLEPAASADGSLSPTQADVLRILRDLDREPVPALEDDLFTVHLVEDRRVYEVLHSADFYTAPRERGGRGLPRAPRGREAQAPAALAPGLEAPLHPGDYLACAAPRYC